MAPVETTPLRTDGGLAFDVDERFLAVSAVARIFDVADVTIKSWVDLGRLLAARTVGGHRRIATSSVVALLREQGRAVPAELVIGRPTIVYVGQSPSLIDSLQRTFAGLAEVEVWDDIYSALLRMGKIRPRVLVFDADSVGAPAVLIGSLRSNKDTHSIHLLALRSNMRSVAATKVSRLGIPSHLHDDIEGIVRAVGAHIA